MRLADPARSPQIEILRGRIEVLGSFKGEPVSWPHLKTFECEFPIRLLPAKQFHKCLARCERPLFVPLPRFKGSDARRAAPIGELAAPNARPGQGFARQ